MERMNATLVFGMALWLAAAGEGAAPQSSPEAWPVHSNPALGYELRHPDGYEVYATGREGERDGSRIRVAREEYAAPSPVLDIYVRHGTAGIQLPDAVRRHWTAEDTDVGMAGSRCAMTTYRFEPGGQIALVDVRCPSVVFRLTPGSGDADVRRTVWWQIMSTFRFLPKREREPG